MRFYFDSVHTEVSVSCAAFLLARYGKDAHVFRVEVVGDGMTVHYAIGPTADDVVRAYWGRHYGGDWEIRATPLTEVSREVKPCAWCERHDEYRH